ncbi:MAG: transcription factor IIA subunit alpha [Chrysothrix sp. TS-e1954]|nr:MAG: transcription factor IIA subunit alpha [Chrysothrix sp. TS-e1954]
MSNTAVGTVYKRVIDAVVEASKTDFEETGIENRVLQVLQEKWQTRLSKGHRANFPWDPQPESASEKTAAPTASQQGQQGAASNAQQQPQRQYQQHQPGSATSPNAGNRPIKQEQYDLNSPNGPSPHAPSVSGNAALHASNPALVASQRAQAMVRAVQQQHFGNQRPNVPPAQPIVNGLPSMPQTNVQQPVQRVAAQPPIKQEAPPHSTTVPQTDGADDAPEQWSDVLASRQAHAGDIVKIDGIIRRRVEDGARRLEAGGLLVPLNERAPSHSQSSLGYISDDHPSSSVNDTSSRPAGLDGVDEEAEEDNDDDENLEDDEVAAADAINSDLDDSDDDVVNGGIEGHVGDDVILCLYDKVQRTKNKWKCTLKDGVVTVEGKDYVFHKATGEFEW